MDFAIFNCLLTNFNKFNHAAVVFRLELVRLDHVETVMIEDGASSLATRWLYIFCRVVNNEHFAVNLWLSDRLEIIIRLFVWIVAA